MDTELTGLGGMGCDQGQEAVENHLEELKVG